jgi:hypothetical protein
MGKVGQEKKIQGTFSIFIIPTNAGILKNAAHDVDKNQVVEEMIHWLEIILGQRGQVRYFVDIVICL